MGLMLMGVLHLMGPGLVLAVVFIKLRFQLFVCPCNGTIFTRGKAVHAALANLFAAPDAEEHPRS
jgi:hypothetical protein